MTIKMALPQVTPNFLSYADATWRDANNIERTRYKVRAMKPGPGFEIVDTTNDTNWRVVSNFATEAAAQELMRTNSVGINRWRRLV